MPFTLDKFASVRPYLYHLTSRRNAARLLAARVIRCSSELLIASNNSNWLDRKRHDSLTILVDGAEIDLRDQRPLHAGKAALQDGWTLATLVRSLNDRVYFWPGWEHKPISYAQRHFERYQAEEPMILRVKTRELIDVNRSIVPLFCKYNSGSPRTTQGKGSPRGIGTFAECGRADYTPSGVVEVTFLGSAQLPAVIEMANNPAGPWCAG